MLFKQQNWTIIHLLKKKSINFIIRIFPLPFFQNSKPKTKFNKMCTPTLTHLSMLDSLRLVFVFFSKWRVFLRENSHTHFNLFIHSFSLFHFHNQNWHNLLCMAFLIGDLWKFCTACSLPFYLEFEEMKFILLFEQCSQNWFSFAIFRYLLNALNRVENQTIFF